MSPPTAVTTGNCTIIGADVLPPSSGGSEALCSIIDEAISARVPSARYTVEIRVFPRSRLSAVLVVDGRRLPEQNFAVMDRDLNASTIRQFANALADQAALAHRPG